MPPRDPSVVSEQLDIAQESLKESPEIPMNDGPQKCRPWRERSSSIKPIYTQKELLSYAKCFVSEDDTLAMHTPVITKAIQLIRSVPSAIIRYGILFPIRLASLSAATIAFFVSLPVAVGLESNSMVATLVKWYCKGILFSLGTMPRYIGEKPWLSEPHVFVANHTSYLDYIVASAHQYPHAVVMARHKGALGFLQNNGLNFLHSMTFDRANLYERKNLAESLRKHVSNPITWPNPMLIFPEGTCVNNKYTIRFQKGAFELGVKVCPIGIKYDRYWGDPYWDTRKGFLNYAFYRMTRWITPVDIVFCTPQAPYDDEDPVMFGDRVKALISDTIGLENVDFNGMAKRDLLKVIN
ncbi:1-acyl-sn-glycerol-3-phosphate acyltransferase [Lichtheimia corymbifera JMRC:FSU:9682]|uniref:1-acyl-sn-glycerol-3-phosphate acyltransferase n=1 Tax=Lichtheimia corymbifera JMRC:FSU:9682 TaxID=1263082 RepID=A0A068RGI8_9FUNG|nr:1-acyl-sn-glycerol-3-phosphate acyltransferase [Lichtheimia corymbifera JMRC:FSU:9682]